MSQESKWQAQMKKAIKVLDRPLLGLAIASIFLYLAELHGLLPAYNEIQWYQITMLSIDIIFLIDLALKIIALRSRYIASPWFLIDAISCLPILTALPAFAASLQSFRFVRGFRMFRVLRSLRILRLLQSLPAFQQFHEQSGITGRARRFERAIYFGVITFSVVFLLTLVGVKKYLHTEFVDNINVRVQRNLTLSEMRAMGGSLNPKEFADRYGVQAVVDGKDATVYFDHYEVTHIANLVEFYLVLGALLGMALLFYLFVHLLKDVSYQQIRGILNVVLPHQVANQFLRNPRSYIEKHRTPGSILFMDIKGFTRACEDLGSDLNTLSNHLESVMDSMAQALSQHRIIIDKFIGDSIMSFAGGPLCPGTPEENAYKMVRAALFANKKLAEQNDPYFRSLKVGGASTADCLIGAFGTSTRLSYTVLGDGVNLASRLEAANTDTKTQNLFCSETKRLCQEFEDITWRCWGTISVKGKVGPLQVYEAFDTQELESVEFIETFHKAWSAFEKKDFKKAKKLFAQANKQRPGGDPPSQDYVSWCKSLLSSGVSEDWEPILATKK